jgi:hypothetical protein
MIQSLGISNPTVSFSGIRGTATKIDSNGEETSFTINLPEDDASLHISNLEGTNRQFSDKKVKLLIPDGSEMRNIGDDSVNYKDVKIDEVSKKSKLSISTYDTSCFLIGKMKDKAELSLSNNGIPNSEKVTSAVIDKIESRDVKIHLGDGTKVTINKNPDRRTQTFRIWSKYLYSEHSGYARISSSNSLEIKG